MKIASLKSGHVAAVQGNQIIALSDALAEQGVLPKGATINAFIARHGELRSAIQAIVEKGGGAAVDSSQLAAPVPNPSKIWAAAANYRRGGDSLANTAGRGEASDTSPEALLEMAFLKPPSAVIGPEQAVIIPRGVEGVYPELELCAVIGKEARNVSKAEAMDAVFGYTIILDMTARSKAAIAAPGGLIGTRCVRKGYETFAPIGPWIATRDEVPDPQALLAQLWVNDELTQSATTQGMINGVAELVSYLSGISSLHPGDLIATGNPDSPQFQRSLEPGDRMRAEIQNIGTLNLSVVAQK